MSKVAVIAILQCRHLKMDGNLRNLCVPLVVRSFGAGWLPSDLSWQGLFPPGRVAVAPGRRNSAEMHQTAPLSETLGTLVYTQDPQFALVPFCPLPTFSSARRGVSWGISVAIPTFWAGPSSVPLQGLALSLVH